MRFWPMSALGHFRPIRPVLLGGRCPLRSESDQGDGAPPLSRFTPAPERNSLGRYRRFRFRGSERSLDCAALTTAHGAAAHGPGLWQIDRRGGQQRSGVQIMRAVRLLAAPTMAALLWLAPLMPA